uniref:50S ribosomal protein L21, chloroplastic n=1 Tax=Cyanidium sp. THAL103 TaxID=3027999 RepID=A0A9Y1I480_9RHOD|nr:ribosomal protein L21 [Cyanidium sp. THAL103]
MSDITNEESHVHDYAILEISGKQFWIEKEKYYDFNYIPLSDLGDKIIFNRILVLKDHNQFYLGQPFLKKVKIEGIILNHFKGPKTIVYKMNPKKKTRKKYGHRQFYTRVFINSFLIL